MQAAVFDGKILQIKDVPKPTIKSHQALIKVYAVGICGTDLAIAKGHLPTPIPLILGHEIVGEVVEIGEKVDKKWLHKRVTPEINANLCGKCFYCQNNILTQCVSRKALGIDIDGGMAEFIALDDYLLHEIPDALTYHQATFIEPVAAAYQTFELMPITPLDRTLVIFGMGKMGLILIQVAKSLSTQLEIVVIDGSDVKLALAKQFGATNVFNRHQIPHPSVEIKKITNGIGADIVVDTTGNPDVLQEVVASCRTRGKIHIKSTHGLAAPLNITDLVVREITIFTSRCGPFEQAIAGLRSGQIKVDQLISAEFPLSKVQDAFASYDKSKDHIKTILTFP